jgi:hypothetical protein
MSVAALQALALEEVLDEGDGDLEQRFFRSAANVLDTPWRLAAGSDLKMPETTGKRTVMSRFMNWYMAKLHKAAQHDPVPALAFYRVTNLLDPPSRLLTAKVVLRVFLGNIAKPTATRSLDRRAKLERREHSMREPQRLRA